MLYAYRCHVEGGHDIDYDWPIGKALPAVYCKQHRCLARRVFSVAALIMGSGFKKPWADKTQKSDEMQAHFMGKR